VDGKSRSVVSRFALVDAFIQETGVPWWTGGDRGRRG